MINPYKLQLSKYSTHNIIRENIGDNKAVLDIGCNEGYLGRVCAKTNIFYGLDYYQENIDKATTFYKDARVYDLNDLKELPWKQKFNVIVFADVLEHILFPEQVLKFFVDHYLKENGQVIISLPNIANWQVRLNLLFGKFDYTDTGIMDKTHLHLYTFRTARRLVLKNNLEITNEFGGASFFGPIIKMFPVLNSLLATNIITTARKR